MWTCLKKGNFKRETEYLLIAVQRNAIRTNQIKARIGKTQQNRKCSLCGDRDETINYIISEDSKIEQKDIRLHMTEWERWSTGKCARNVNLTIQKWYMHNPAAVLEKYTHKLLWDLDIHMDHLIWATRPDLIIINNKKENMLNCWLYCPGESQIQIERKGKEG